MDEVTAHIYRFYGYLPNKSLAIVGAVVYGVLMCLIFARVYFSKCRKFLYILPATALVECIGYAIRVSTASNISLGSYVAMTFCLLLAPNALALVNYKAVGEIIRLSNTQHDRFFLKPKFVTWFFFWSDFLAFFLQASGGGLQATSNPSMYETGAAVALVGLAAQLVFFACFAGITYYVHKNPKYNFHVEGIHNAKQKLCGVLYVTIILLYIRSIYRVAEFAGGRGGAVASAEWAFYIFDGLAIALSFVVYIFFFIGTYLPRSNHVNISSGSSSSVINQKTQHREDIEMLQS
ncbi:RTA1 like protein-domain-containing protein [Blakeslea trispora]|nr:RTA1 like protein-domain-containing protein [Blakeslea trispora]